MDIYAPNRKSVHLQPVRSIQTYLREISRYYSDIPVVIPDGIYGPETTAAVRQFQLIFGLPATGEVDINTWDLLLYVYSEINKRTEGPEALFPISFIKKNAVDCRNCVLDEDDTGYDVLMVQIMLQTIAEEFDNIKKPELTGRYDSETVASVKDFQKHNKIEDTGKIDRLTWNNLAKFYNIHGVDRGPIRVPYQNLSGNL